MIPFLYILVQARKQLIDTIICSRAFRNFFIILHLKTAGNKIWRYELKYSHRWVYFSHSERVAISIYMRKKMILTARWGRGRYVPRKPACGGRATLRICNCNFIISERRESTNRDIWTKDVKTEENKLTALLEVMLAPFDRLWHPRSENHDHHPQKN